MKKATIFFLAVIILAACSKTIQEPENLQKPALHNLSDKGPVTKAPDGGGGSNTPVVTTSSVNINSAIMGVAYGNVTSGGKSSSITERGFCYKTSSGPTISNDTIRAGSGTGNFQGVLKNLLPGTLYYVKAYAIKSGVVYYGNELNFTTLTINNPTPGVGLVYDIDGNVYNTLTYNGKVWMLENLKTTRFRDGTPIANITDNNAWRTATIPAYCNYNNDVAIGNEYGRLYNLLTVHDSRGLAPAGWRIPTLNEWTEMLQYLGGGGVAGGRIKEAGFTHWNTPNTGDLNGGFNAFGGGYRDYYLGTFNELKVSAQFWSSTSSTGGAGTNASMNNIILQYNSANNLIHMGSYMNGHTLGYSVRCIKE